MTNITIEEQHIGRNTTQHFHLHFLTKHISLAELIQCKVFQEAQQDKEIIDCQWARSSNYVLQQEVVQEAGIVEAEGALASTFYRFQNQAFLIVVNGEQKTDLQEELEVTEDMAIQFINW